MSQPCVRCGGVIDAASPWVCRYCGAAQPLADGRVPLTDDGVLGLLREAVTGVDSTSLHPGIPAKKLEGVRKTHAAYLPPEETVLAVYDGTVFGSATDGFFVTSRRLGFKNQMGSAHFLEWVTIDPSSVWADDVALVVGPARIDTLYDAEDEGLFRWAEAIASIARSARPASAATMASPAQPSGPSAWDAARSSWPEPPPARGRSDVLERFPQRPYADASGVSVVDVHPSGQLVVACSGALVDLRSAGNGARHRAFQAPDVVLAARFAPDGQRLAIGGLDRRATIYDVGAGQILGQTPTMEDTCDEIVWLGTTGKFAMASQRGELWIVDAATCQPVHRILGPDPEYAQLGGLSATAGGEVVFLSLERRLGAFDTARGTILWRFDDALTNASRLAVSPRGDVLVAVGYDGVALFDARTGQPGARYPLPCPRGVSWPSGGGGVFGKSEHGEYSWSPRPRFSPRGDVVAVQDYVGNLAFIDTSTFALHPTPRERGRAWIEDLAWFGDGNHVAIGSSDSTLTIWRVRPMAGILQCTVNP